MRNRYICINKLRKSNGVIIAYVLKDLSNNIIQISHDELKKKLKNKSINVVNLQLSSDKRIVDKAVVSSLTKDLYLTICNNRNFIGMEDYKFDIKFVELENKLYIRYRFHPHFGLNLEQAYFSRDKFDRDLVVTDQNSYYFVHDMRTNELILKTQDKLLTLNVLHIIDNRINLIDKVADASALIKSAFSDFSSSDLFVELTRIMRGSSDASGFDFLTSQYLFYLCLIELRYEYNQRMKGELGVKYRSYVFRGQDIKDRVFDSSYRSTTLSFEVATTYGDGGIILAISNVQLYNFINVQEVASYDKDVINYEHELLLRAFSKLNVEEQIGVLKNIPVYKATLEMPNYKSRVKCIIDVFTKLYGMNNQFRFLGYVFSHLSLVKNIDYNNHYETTIFGKEFSVVIEFDNDKDTVMLNNISFTDLNKMIDYYNQVLTS